MKVRELIEVLSRYDGDLTVVAFDGHDPSDLAEVTRVVGDGPLSWLDADRVLHPYSDMAIRLVTA